MAICIKYFKGSYYPHLLNNYLIFLGSYSESKVEWWE